MAHEWSCQFLFSKSSWKTIPTKSNTAHMSILHRSFCSLLRHRCVSSLNRETKTHQQQVINGPVTSRVSPLASPSLSFSSLACARPLLLPFYSSRSEVLPAGSSTAGLCPFLSPVSIRQKGKAPCCALRALQKTHHPAAAAEGGGSADGCGWGKRRGEEVEEE